MSLVSHADSLPQATKDAFRTMWGILSHLLPAEATPTLDQVVEWGARIRTNMHSISWMDAQDQGVNLNLFGQIVGANAEVGAAVRPCSPCAPPPPLLRTCRFIQASRFSTTAAALTASS